MTSMRGPSLAIFLVTASAAAFGYSQRAAAQTSDQPSAATGGIEEIVVTARRREEKVQTVPLAITAFSGRDIEQKHIQELRDLGLHVPSLNVEANASDANGLAPGQVRLRGLSGTIVYFADVPIGTTDAFAGGITSFSRGAGPQFYYDLDNVEVVKGPQGTLFGKNSIGGLISVDPKKPTNDYEGYAKATFGNYNDREFEAAINIPIVQDKLLVRIAGQSQQRDGYTKNLTTGADLDNRNNYAWRVGVILRPTDDIENYFLYDGYWQDTNGTAVVPRYANTGFTFSAIPLPGIAKPVPITLGQGLPLSALENPATAAATYFALLKTAQAGGQPSLAFFPSISQVITQQQQLGARDVLGSVSPTIGKDYLYGFTNTTTWDLGDDLTIKNVAGARIFKQLSTAADFGGPLQVLTVGDPFNPHEWSDNSVQYTEEPQLQGNGLGGKLKWVLGGFLEFNHPVGDDVLPTNALGNVTYTHYHNSARSQAAFLHGIFDLSDYVGGLRLTTGYRYTWDYSSVQERDTAGVDAVVHNAASVATNCGAFLFDNNCYSSSSASFSAYGWNVSLDEQLDPDTLLYVRAGNAYRPGSSNPNVPAEFQSLKPEHVTDVEIGAKVDWTLFGAHLRTNGDVFHTDYKAIQVNEFVQVTNGQGATQAATLETNAASAYLEGAEFEGTFIPFTGADISAHASYLYTHYDKYPPVQGAPAGYTPPFYFAPKWLYGIQGTYHLPVDASLGDIAITADYSWVGQQYDNAMIGDPIQTDPSYANVNVRVDWTNVLGYSLDAEFFMTNALDATHINGVFPLYGILGFTSVTYNEPRMFGFSLKYRFDAPGAEEPAAAAYAPPPIVAPAPTARGYQVFFDFNKSDLTPQAVQIVDTAAKNAGPAHVTQLTVTGHTDTVGSDAYNMRLSKRRAESVAAALEKDGIPSSEIEIVAKGKGDLLIPTADGVKEPQNRRVQILYSGGPTS